MLKRTAAGCAIGLTAALFATTALCQEIEELVVTAQKREQSLQDVPLSVQVLGGEQLRASQFNSVANLDVVSPSITFARHYHPSAHNVTIRGIGTQVSADGGYIQQSVIVSVDGIAASRAAGFWGDLPDIERIEILRGPQGTLFGKNATAGVLNITTRAPLSEFGAEGEVAIADDTGVNASASLTGGLGDNIRTRLTVWHNRNEGWGENYGTAPHDIGWLRNYGARAKVGLDLGPSATLLLTGAYNWTHTNGQWFLGGANSSGAPGQRQNEALFPIIAGPHNDKVKINSDPFTNVNTYNLSAQLDWNITDEIELISLTSYSHHHLKFRIDTDQVDLAFTPENLQIHGLLSWPDSRTYQIGSEFTQEVRLHGVQGRLDWTVGAFYSDYQEIFNTDQLQMTLASPVVTRRWRDVNYQNISWAVFADGEFGVTDALHLIGGIRYTHEDFEYTYFRDNSTPTRVVTFGPWTGEASDDGLGARAGLRWDVAPRVNVYGMWSLGYKGPALDLSDQFRDQSKVLISAEDAKSIEFGVKSTLLDNRLRLNVAVFQTEIANFQAFKIIPPTGTQLVTAGDVRSRGVEVDANLAVNEDLYVDLNAVWDDGTYQNTIFDCYPGQTATLGCTIDQDGNGVRESQNLTGKPLALLPEWKFTLSARYERPVPGRDFSVYFRPAYVWQSKVQFSINQDPRTIRDGVGLLDLAAGIRNTDDGWDVQFFVKNATDEFYYARRQFVQSIGGPYHTLSREYDRYMGVKLRLAFGAAR